MTGRMTTATYEGRTYEIPEIWIAGFCHHGATVHDAIIWWAYQAELKRIEEANREQGQ